MSFGQMLRRHFWVVILLFTCGIAHLNAQGVTQMVGAELGADPSSLAAAPIARRAAAAAATASDHATSADAILDRNPFDSVTGPLGRGPRTTIPGMDASAVPPPDLDDVNNAPICDGVKVLIIAASSDADWSFAAFSGGGGSEKRNVLRRRGGDLNGKTVKYIGWEAVWLTNPDHTLCQAKMFAPPPPAASSKPSAGGGMPPGAPKGIVQKSATEFDIDRGLVDKILENQADLIRQAHIQPEQEHSKTVGIRVNGIRPDTLLGALGMENNDRLEKINGFDLTNPEKALEAYARLQTATHLTISLTRGGIPTNIDYNIK